MENYKISPDPLADETVAIVLRPLTIMRPSGLLSACRTHHHGI